MVFTNETTHYFNTDVLFMGETHIYNVRINTHTHTTSSLMRNTCLSYKIRPMFHSSMFNFICREKIRKNMKK